MRTGAFANDLMIDIFARILKQAVGHNMAFRKLSGYEGSIGETCWASEAYNEGKTGCRKTKAIARKNG